MSLESLSVTEASSEIRKGKVSPLDYARALLEHIDRVEPRIEAWVTIDREAVLAEASKCTREAKDKSFRGPLHGVPIGIKDIFYTKDLRTTAGSPIFHGFVPDRDSRAVAKLKQAGAIVLGKTVTTQFALSDPGPTRNPWNTAHTPGGSSSGSAAAVAARMVPGAIGSQTGGSTARPAAFCGIVGLLPTASRIGREGVFPLSWSLDHVGLFARSVRDIEILLAVMSESRIERPAPRGVVRIGVIRDFFYSKCTEEARALHDAVVKRLANTKVLVEEARLPAVFEVATIAHRLIMRTEAGAAHEGLHNEHAESYGPRIRALVESGLLVDSTPYLRALRIRKHYQKEMAALFSKWDVLLTPSATGPAPQGLASTGDSILNLPWTMADFPTISLPHTLASNGLPVAIQLTAPPLQEGVLLQIAGKLEQAIEFRQQPKL